MHRLWLVMTVGTLALTAAASEVRMDWAEVRQGIDGFGACDAWYSDRIMEHPKAKEIMDRLFLKDGGIGLSILRQRIDPDVMTGPDTYNWKDSDYLGNGWLAQQALARDCSLVWAAPWTPPAWMKSNQSIKGGGFLLPEYYQAYADFIQTVCRTFQADFGVHYAGISVQNEPGKKEWESCEWTDEQFIQFIGAHLGPTLDPAVQIIFPEGTGWGEVDARMQALLGTPAEAYIDILAGHCYWGTPSNNQTATRFPGLRVWETEWSYDTTAEQDDISNGLDWAQKWWSLLTKAEVNACHYWWLANMGEDGKQQALINSTGKRTDYVTTKRLWTLGNYSKFIRPGWNRIAATPQPSAEVYCSAFRHPDSGEFVLVVVNQSTQDQALEVVFSGFTAAQVVPHITSQQQDLAQLAALPTHGQGLHLVLPAQSVVSYVGVGTALH